ncbi:MAG: flagellar filament capping protein FliD [Desulfovibrio sp.]|nr:flagellar filament capping protein FliD [Desulfovibrio sp.]
MSTLLSGSTAISGLGGYDTDFDTVLKQLKQVESTKLNRLEAWKSDWNLRYTAFNEVIDQITAAKNMLGTLNAKTKFVQKSATSSNENVVTAVASALADDVQHSITVSQMASNAIWANTSRVFASGADLINTTGEAQEFKFSYGGKDFSITVAANTTLDSFVSLVNNNVNNPGVKISLIQTGNGYAYQIAGKDTGVDKDLIVYSCNLEGMSAAGTTSTWMTNSALDLARSVTNPTSFIYDVTLASGKKKTISLSGDKTADDLVTALNTCAGQGVVTASLDENGNLLVSGVQSITRREKSQDAYTPGGTKVNVGSGINDPLLNGENEETLNVTVTLAGDKTREFSISSKATKQDFLKQLWQSTQDGDDVYIEMDSGGTYFEKLAGVLSENSEGNPGISVTRADGSGAVSLSELGISLEQYDSEGVGDLKDDQTLTSVKTTLTFAAGELDKRIDGKTSGDGEKAEYTIVLQDGSAIYVNDTTAGMAVSGAMTNGDLATAIQNAMTAAGHSGDVTVTTEDGNTVLSLNGVKSVRLTTGDFDDSAGHTSSLESAIRVEGSAAFHTGTGGTRYLEEPPQLVYTVTRNDGTQETLNFESGTTMRTIVAALKTSLGDDAVTLVDAEGGVWDPASGTQPYLALKDVQSLSGPGISGQTAESSNWSIQRSCNAVYRMDNWPMEMESSSNTLSDVIEGVVINVQDTGTAKISVATDVASIETSIQNFLDAVNSVIMVIRDYMKVDDDKEVTSNDPKDIGKSNYSASNLTQEKGGLLTGNYGVQLLRSRFTSLLSATPPGFQSVATADDILSGDVLANLSNLGIKTDTDSTSQTYGLLVIAPSSGISAMQTLDQENYNDMITNHANEVVDFFCTIGTGASTTSDFRYGSHISGITKAGIYDVSYTVDGSGNIEHVYVGGVEATRDEDQPGYYYSVASGDAKGLSILIDDLNAGTHTGQVRIKQGLVQTVKDFLEAELKFTDVGVSSGETSVNADALSLKSENGALMILKANYKSIMDNIDKAIAREETRISTWEARQKKVFSNLETILKNYSGQQKSLESQISQLSSGS